LSYKPQPLSDEDLVRLYVKTQSAVYFDEIYERYANKVYGKCIALLHSEDAAQDALQDIFLKIYLNIANFNLNSRFTTWVYAVCYNYCIDFIRKQRRVREIFDETEIEHCKDMQDVSDTEIAQIEGEYLIKVLRLLNEDDRLILLMKYQDSMQIKEICDVLNKSESAVKMQIKRAKQRAKNHYLNLTAKIIQ
jgi:RNA polymerase sigma factor (sigma-70 family)